jgi:hypothetical protein
MVRHSIVKRLYIAFMIVAMAHAPLVTASAQESSTWNATTLRNKIKISFTKSIDFLKEKTKNWRDYVTKRNVILFSATIAGILYLLLRDKTPKKENPKPTPPAPNVPPAPRIDPYAPIEIRDPQGGNPQMVIRRIPVANQFDRQNQDGSVNQVEIDNSCAHRALVQCASIVADLNGFQEPNEFHTTTDNLANITRMQEVVNRLIITHRATIVANAHNAYQAALARNEVGIHETGRPLTIDEWRIPFGLGPVPQLIDGTPNEDDYQTAGLTSNEIREMAQIYYPDQNFIVIGDIPLNARDVAAHIRQIQQNGIHPVVVATGNHWYSLVINRQENQPVQYLFADSVGPSGIWQGHPDFPATRFLLNFIRTVEAQNPAGLQAFNALRQRIDTWHARQAADRATNKKPTT